jgi:hypothetical protein
MKKRMKLVDNYLFRNGFVIIFILGVFFYLYKTCGEISLKCFEDKLFQKPSCDYYANIFRERECLMIFEKMDPFGSYSFVAEGKHLISKQDCTCSDNNDRWWTQYEEYLEKGDTIIKRKGELVFSIHKKDTVLNFNWECEGKVYK